GRGAGQRDMRGRTQASGATHLGRGDDGFPPPLPKLGTEPEKEGRRGPQFCCVFRQSRSAIIQAVCRQNPPRRRWAFVLRRSLSGYPRSSPGPRLGGRTWSSVGRDNLVDVIQ